MMKLKNKSGLIYKLVIGAVLIFYSIMLLSLFFYALINSFKDSWGFILDPVGFPEIWHFDNYIKIFNNLKMQKNVLSPVYYLEHMFGGSILYALFSAVSITLATTMMAYACAQFPCKISNIIYWIVMFVITVPIIGSLPSEMKVIRELKFYDNLFSAIPLKFQFGNIYFLLLFEAIRTIPADYKEAAEIDGASMLVIMVKIMLPMIGNIVGSVFLVQFIAFWNDYSTPVMYYPSVPNIAVGLIDFAFSTSGVIAEEPFKLGACVLSLLPMLIVFAVFQKKLIGGISAAGIKG